MVTAVGDLADSEPDPDNRACAVDVLQDLKVAATSWKLVCSSLEHNCCLPCSVFNQGGHWSLQEGCPILTW